MKKKIVISVDVEAQPLRARDNHIDSLIWGKAGKLHYGINLMMSMASEHNVKLTLFLDYIERQLYGESLLDVGREIIRREHDLQIHMHPDLSSKNFLELHSLYGETDLCSASKDSCKYFFDYVMESHSSITTKKAIAYRSGGYRLSHNLLEILSENGIIIDSSHNPYWDRSPLGRIYSPPFFWKNALFEIPIPCLAHFENRPVLPYNFNASVFLQKDIEKNIAAHKHYLEKFFARFGNNAIATLVMHSWSFFNKNDEGYFETLNPIAVETFHELLPALKQDYDITTTQNIADTIYYEHEKSKYTQFNEYTKQSICSICNTPKVYFIDSAGISQRQCPFCKSVERQRTFVDIYTSNFAGKNTFENNKLLHISPSFAEKILLANYKFTSITSVDIRPELKTTHVCDISNLECFAEKEFNSIFLSFVLSCTKDIDKAVSELYRVLKDDGIIFCYDPISKNKKTLEITDIASITSYYGEENLHKYSVGRFRIFGSLDHHTYFEKYFSVEHISSIDTITGIECTWTVLKKIIMI